MENVFVIEAVDRNVDKEPVKVVDGPDFVDIVLGEDENVVDVGNPHIFIDRKVDQWQICVHKDGDDPAVEIQIIGDRVFVFDNRGNVILEA